MYPDQEASIRLKTGTLGLSDFTLSMSSSLLSAVRQEAKDNIGVCSTLACIQRAHEWLSTGGWVMTTQTKPVTAAAAAAVTESKGQENLLEGRQDLAAVEPKAWYLLENNEAEEGGGGTGTGNAEEEDKKMIADATLEATSLACQLRSAALLRSKGAGSAESSSSSCRQQTAAEVNVDIDVDVDTVSSELLLQQQQQQDAQQGGTIISSSARGVWRYTVALIGKPSAGKSTFYNAATRAALERDGRKLGE